MRRPEGDPDDERSEAVADDLRVLMCDLTLVKASATTGAGTGAPAPRVWALA